MWRISGRAAAPSGGLLEDPARCYLLFAGSHKALRGGLGDLVATFTCEATARQAFRDIRLCRSPATSWAQLGVIDAHDGIRVISWFGIGATPPRKQHTTRAEQVNGDTGRARRLSPRGSRQ